MLNILQEKYGNENILQMEVLSAAERTASDVSQTLCPLPNLLSSGRKKQNQRILWPSGLEAMVQHSQCHPYSITRTVFPHLFRWGQLVGEGSFSNWFLQQVQECAIPAKHQKGIQENPRLPEMQGNGRKVCTYMGK